MFSGGSCAAICFDIKGKLANEVASNPAKAEFDLRALTDFVEVRGKTPSDNVSNPVSERILSFDVWCPSRGVACGTPLLRPVLWTWDALSVWPGCS